jgi:cytochrome c oxidase subunit 3
MNIVVMFALIVFAILLWWMLLQKLKAKPWLNQGVELEAINSFTFYPPKVIGLGVFLAVVTALFALFSAAYHMRMAVPDWTHLPLPKILWLNTALLILSSVALQWAWSSTEKISINDKTNESLDNIRHVLLGGSSMALAFLAGQLVAWQQLNAIGFFFSCSPASAFFYLFTGLHGLHLLGGLVVLSKTIIKSYHQDFFNRAAIGETLLSIKLCAIYWHYLLLIWLAIFALLLST